MTLLGRMTCFWRWTKNYLKDVFFLNKLSVIGNVWCKQKCICDIPYSIFDNKLMNNRIKISYTWPAFCLLKTHKWRSNRIKQKGQIMYAVAQYSGLSVKHCHQMLNSLKKDHNLYRRSENSRIRLAFLHSSCESCEWNFVSYTKWNKFRYRESQYFFYLKQSLIDCKQIEWIYRIG